MATPASYLASESSRMQFEGVQSVALVGGKGSNRLSVDGWQQGQTTLDGGEGIDFYTLFAADLGRKNVADTGNDAFLDSLLVFGIVRLPHFFSPFPISKAMNSL